MTFLSVIRRSYPGVALRIYRNADTAKLCLRVSAEKYVDELRIKYGDLWVGKKIVVILWEDGDKRMADMWVFGKNESDNAGASVSVYLFRELERYESPVVTAADGLVVLGEEAIGLTKK